MKKFNVVAYFEHNPPLMLEVMADDEEHAREVAEEDIQEYEDDYGEMPYKYKVLDNE